MNLLQGDHVVRWIWKRCVVAAACESHESGSPHTTRAKGRACEPYSFRTIDVFGANGSAEW